MGVSLTVIDPADCDGLDEILKTKVSARRRNLFNYATVAR